MGNSSNRNVPVPPHAQHADYTAQQLPQLWIPLRTDILVYRSKLAGVTPLNPFSGGENAQDWYYVKS